MVINRIDDRVKNLDIDPFDRLATLLARILRIVGPDELAVQTAFQLYIDLALLSVALPDGVPLGLDHFDALAVSIEHAREPSMAIITDMHAFLSRLCRMVDHLLQGKIIVEVRYLMS